MRRILASIIFFGALIVAPWWLTAVLGLIFLILYKNFWEIVIGALFIDLIYGTPVVYFGDFTFMLTACALIFLLIRRIISDNIFVKAFKT